MRTARSSSRHLCVCGGGGGGGFCLSAGVVLETPPAVGLETPPAVGLETPLRCGPGRPPGLETPPGCGSGELPSQTPQPPPPGCGPGDPQARPLNLPLGAGLETPQPNPSSFPLGVGLEILGYTPLGDLQGMLGYHLQGMLGYHPPPTNRITDTCKNITFPQLRLRAVIKRNVQNVLYEMSYCYGR